jgi:hypothetical protein
MYGNQGAGGQRTPLELPISGNFLLQHLFADAAVDLMHGLKTEARLTYGP